MPSRIRPVLVSRDLERLAGFYRSLRGAEETGRVPAEGPTFYVGLRIGADMPWGQRVAHVQDPDGNTVNLTQQL